MVFAPFLICDARPARAGKRAQAIGNAAYATLPPIALTNGLAGVLSESAPWWHLFRRLDDEGRTLWSRISGAHSRHGIAILVDRGQSGAIFLDFRDRENKLTFSAVDDQGR